jgi:general secretion pathway protein H
MTWRAEDDRLGTYHSGAYQSGFTMIEMIVVLVVLGLMLGLVIGRGPMRSPTLDARVAARELTQALRLARSRAITLDRPVSLLLDRVAHDVRIDGARSLALPRDVGVSAATSAGVTISDRVVDITFASDGSSSGARIALGAQDFRRVVVVDWLTGRVRIDDPR